MSKEGKSPKPHIHMQYDSPLLSRRWVYFLPSFNLGRGWGKFVTSVTNRICWKRRCASSGHSRSDSFCFLPIGCQQPCKRCENPETLPWRQRAGGEGERERGRWAGERGGGQTDRQRPWLGREKAAKKWNLYPSYTFLGHVIRDIPPS